MSQHYSDPKRQEMSHALPDLEVFYYDDGQTEDYGRQEPGWYWHACFPGCLPDGKPVGPFETEAEALADARGNDND